MPDPIIPNLPNWRAQELLGLLYGKQTRFKFDLLTDREMRALVDAGAARWASIMRQTIAGTAQGRDLWNKLRARIK